MSIVNAVGSEEPALPCGDPDDLSVIDVFRHHVARRPDAPVILAEGRTVSYGELDQRSDSLAVEILTRELPRDVPVAICTDSYVDLLTARLAILKCSHFYVMIDPDFPSSRNEVILRESGAVAVAGSPPTMAGIESILGERIVIDASAPRDPVDASILPVASPDAPASLGFTSGSTGKPKGIVKTQRAIVRSLLVRVALGYDSDDRISGLLSPAFAASNSDVYGAILAGAALCPFTIRDKSLRALEQWINDRSITVLHMVPTLFRHLMAVVDADRKFDSVRIMRLTSEAASRNDLEKVRAHFSEACRIYMSYACSETGAISNTVIDPRELPEGHLLPLGRPVNGVTVEIVDEDDKAVEPGQTGEIVVSGLLASDGYWRAPDLTLESFEQLGGGRTRYRTGDLGRILPDGQLVHLGRRDTQVKIRGHRVEIGEVESALQADANIREAMVAARPNRAGDNSLVAWVVPATEEISVEAIKRTLQHRLPEAMIPGMIVLVSELPMAPNGKLDRSAVSRLPIPEIEVDERDDGTEPQLIRLWNAAGGSPIDDPADDLIESGGDSITLVHFFARVEKTFDVRLPVTQLMKEVSIRSLARIIETRPPYEPQRILEFNADGSRVPLFIVPGKGGNAIGMRRVAAAIDPDQPVYILQFGHEGKQLDRIELIAEDFVRIVRSIQPIGPYRILGASFGGLVAFEIARALSLGGEEIEIVGLLDTKAARAGSVPIWKRWKAMKSKGKSPMRQLVKLTRLKLGEPWREIKSEFAKLMLRYGSRVPESLAQIELQNMVAGSRYRGNHWSGRVVLFRADEGMIETTPYDDLGWSRFTGDELEIVDIPGNHFSMTSEENAPGLARAIEDAILRVGNSTATSIPSTAKDPTLTARGPGRRTRLETLVEERWIDVGGIRTIDPSDDLRATGAEERVIERLRSRIENDFRLTLPAASLEKGVSLRSLAEIVTKKAPLARDRIVEFNAEGTRAPLFVIPGRGGLAMGVRNIALALEKDQPVYVLQYATDDRIVDRVETMANDFVQLIRTLQPEGPYCVLGSSFGGVIAFEIARQLDEADQTVAFLGLLDTLGPTLGRRSVIERIRIARQMGRKPHRVILRHIRTRLGEPWRDLRRSVHRLRLRFGKSLPKTLAMIELQTMNAARHYRASPWRGRGILFRAAAGNWTRNPPDLGWTDLVQSGLEIIEIPGDHTTMTSVENSPVVAKRIQEALEDALDDRSR